MEQRCTILFSKTLFGFLLGLVLFKSTTSQELCHRVTFNIAENNSPATVVGIIPTSEGVTVNIRDVDSSFSINGNQLIADVALDFETGKIHIVAINCTRADYVVNNEVVVSVINVNDEPPVFEQSEYSVNVPEFSPQGTTIGMFPAKDLDNKALYYTLEPETEGFQLQAISLPNILVAGHLDYEKVKSVKFTLTARDTGMASPPGEPSFTGTTTILVTILDVDNRPPWFQPCTLTMVGTATICLGSGYTGSVNLTEQVIGAIPLEPGPVYAIDGDTVIKEEISYTFLSGNEASVFAINDRSGNITMLKAADVPGPIVLRVLAAQRINSHQFATTMVTIQIVPKSLNPPRFEKAQYEGFISEVGSMVMDANDTSTPLKVVAKDADFAEGLNPHVTYVLQGSSDITYFNGFLLLTRELPLGPVSLQLTAEDPSNGESTTTTITVEVTSGLPTTSVASSTTDMVSTTMALTSDTTQVETILPTTTVAASTTDMVSTTMSLTSDTAQVTSETILPTTNASPTTPYDPTSDKPTEGVAVQSGGYGAEDMAALGASLAVLLIICIVAIGFLTIHVMKGKAAWRKLSEASVFRSSLGRGLGHAKEGVQYTNEGFQNDGETGSGGFKDPDGTVMKLSSFSQLGTQSGDGALEIMARSSAPLHALLPDNSSLAGSDKADSEKEVKPILTKERRVEEGYKSVWFKEDIDPNAKEEVVIIPDNEDHDNDEDDEDEEEDNSPSATPNADGKVRLGVKINSDNDDSEDDEVLNADL